MYRALVVLVDEELAGDSEFSGLRLPSALVGRFVKGVRTSAFRLLFCCFGGAAARVMGFPFVGDSEFGSLALVWLGGGRVGGLNGPLFGQTSAEPLLLVTT